MGHLVRRAQASVVTAWIVFAVGIVILLAWAGLSLAFVSDQLQRKVPGDGVWIGPLVMAFFFVPFGAAFAVKGYLARHFPGPSP